MLYDLDEGTSQPFTSHGNRVCAAAFDPTSRWVITGDTEGIVRVGPITGETPHLLFGHHSAIVLAVSPDGRWIASSDANEPTVCLWPMPEAPPLQTLPYDELMARLRAMTSLRVVRHATSPQGYRLDRGPFPDCAPAQER
jgi:WD40 repeat protein